MRQRRLLPQALAATVLTGVLQFVPATADHVVYFVNGKAITVKKVEPGDRLTILEIDGGGRIGVPTAQIDRIEELQVSTAQGVPAPSQAVAPSQAATGTQGPSAGGSDGGLPPASQPTALGFSGPVSHPTGAPGGLAPPEVSGSQKQEGSVRAPATTPSAVGAPLRRGIQPGANRQMGGRWSGGPGQPGAGLRRLRSQPGGLRGRPMAAYQAPPAAADQHSQGTADEATAQPAAPPATPPAGGEPAVDPPVPQEPEGQSAEAQSENEATPSDPASEPEGDEPPEER